MLNYFEQSKSNQFDFFNPNKVFNDFVSFFKLWVDWKGGFLELILIPPQSPKLQLLNEKWERKLPFAVSLCVIYISNVRMPRLIYWACHTNLPLVFVFKPYFPWWTYAWSATTASVNLKYEHCDYRRKAH